MLQINPKKFKNIENKSIPSPLRPKFRNKSETNIYFLSKRKFSITLDFDVYEYFNPYEINWKKLFQIEGQEHLNVNIKNIDEDLDTNWYCDS